MQKEPLLFRKFDGGWNTEDASDELEINESPDMVNADFAKGGAIVKMDGIKELGSDSESAIISTLVKAPQRNGTNYLFKFAGTKLKIYDSVKDVWLTIMTGLTAGGKWGDDTFNNVLILVSTVDDAIEIDLGEITRLSAAITSGDTTIPLDDATQFASSGKIYVNNTLVTYTGKSGNTLTGCTGTPDADDNSMVLQEPTTHSSIPKGNMCVNFGGRLMIAGVTGSGGATLYGSKATDRTDFSIAGGGASNDAIAEPLNSKINAIRVFHDNDSNERIMAFLASNTIYTVGVEDNATLGTLVTSNFFKENVTAINQFSTIVGQNDIFHVDLDNQIRTLGPRPTGNSKINFSDSISTKHKTLFRDDYNFDDASGAIVNNEYWCICKEDNENYNDRVVIYNLVTGAWKKRIGFMSADIIEFNNKITIASAVENKVFQVETNLTNDDNNPIYFKYSTFDIDISPLRFERIRAVRISGVISKLTSLTVKIYRDFGKVLLGTYIISGDNNEIISSSTGDGGSFGNVAFGDVPFGGEESDDRRFFIAHLELPAMPDTENFRVVIENNQEGVYLRISKIKPLVIRQKEDYFPSNYILENNN